MPVPTPILRHEGKEFDYYAHEILPNDETQYDAPFHAIIERYSKRKRLCAKIDVADPDVWAVMLDVIAPLSRWKKL